MTSRIRTKSAGGEITIVDGGDPVFANVDWGPAFGGDDGDPLEPTAEIELSALALAGELGAEGAIQLTRLKFVYEVPGSYTVTIPTNANSVTAELWGGGGGGGGQLVGVAAGGGGGGGGYALGTVSVTPGNSYNLVVGDESAPGNIGQNTYWNFVDVVAQGGGPGGAGFSGGQGNGGVGGGSGASPNVGDVTYVGGTGGGGGGLTTLNGGGGGGGAGDTEAGGDGDQDGTPGDGGDALGGDGGQGSVLLDLPDDGLIYGGGGGGESSTVVSAGLTTGAQGRAVITVEVA